MSIAAPATNPASDLELKLPATIGTANQYLKNSGTAGILEFATLAGGKILQAVHQQEDSASMTLNQDNSIFASDASITVGSNSTSEIWIMGTTGDGKIWSSSEKYQEARWELHRTTANETWSSVAKNGTVGRIRDELSSKIENSVFVFFRDNDFTALTQTYKFTHRLQGGDNGASYGSNFLLLEVAV